MTQARHGFGDMRGRPVCCGEKRQVGACLRAWAEACANDVRSLEE